MKNNEINAKPADFIRTKLRKDSDKPNKSVKHKISNLTTKINKDSLIINHKREDVPTSKIIEEKESDFTDTFTKLATKFMEKNNSSEKTPQINMVFNNINTNNIILNSTVNHNKLNGDVLRNLKPVHDFLDSMTGSKTTKNKPVFIDGKHARLDRKGIPIIKGLKQHKISFGDKVAIDTKFVEYINVESFKQLNMLNTYSEKGSGNKGNNRQVSCCILF